MEISFEESVFGVERKVLLYKTSKCDVCHGTGGEPKTGMKTCGACNGNGQIKEIKKSFMGSFSTVRSCDKCGGKGKIPENLCRTCRGAGVLRRQEEVSVAVPAGIENGEMIRLTGAGEAISQGQAGDLYIKIHVKKHPVFRKEGFNLVMDLSIKLSSALMGDEYSVPTLSGDLKVKIPEGIKNGEMLRIKGRGVPDSTGRKGDLLIRLNLEMPKKLSRQARKLIEELKKEGL